MCTKITIECQYIFNKFILPRHSLSRKSPSKMPILNSLMSKKHRIPWLSIHVNKEKENN